jgi:hypothetical protein
MGDKNKLADMSDPSVDPVDFQTSAHVHQSQVY